MMSVGIIASGMHVPDEVVTNDDLAKIMDTSDEWIQQRSGIKERRRAAPGQGPSDLAYEATQKALNQANLQAHDLDLIVVATLTPDYYFPGTSAFLQDRLGLETTPAMDIRCQCSGFIYALNVARNFVAMDQYKRVLVVGSEVHSCALDYSDQGRNVTVLFGDGAGAVIVGQTSGQSGFVDFRLHSQGEHRDHLKIEYPTARKQPFIDQEALADGGHFPQMDGRFVFRHAVARMTEVVTSILADQELKPADVDHYIFHQANLRINEAVLKQLDQPITKSFNNIERYGNCSAASIPMCLTELVDSGRVKEGDLICMTAFGAGFTWGSTLLRW